MKNNLTLKYLKNIFCIVMLIYCLISFFKNINNFPNVRLLANGSTAIELSNSSQKNIYTKLNKIEFNNEIIPEPEFDYGGGSLIVSYQIEDVLYEWYCDGHIIKRTIYDNGNITTNEKYDKNQEMFIYLGDYFIKY